MSINENAFENVVCQNGGGGGGGGGKSATRGHDYGDVL